MVIAIDGPAASGKSITAKLLAEKLGFVHLNSGLMYRAITFVIIDNQIEIRDFIIDDIFKNNSLIFKGEHLNKVYFNDTDITKELYTEKINKNIKKISNNLKIRKRLIAFQREIVKEKNVICEGRDIGSIVFPNADYKFYLIADLKSRIDRRYREIKKNNINISRIGIKSNIIKRDYNDMNRSISPLTKAVDAIEIDTTLMSINEQVKYIYKKIK